MYHANSIMIQYNIYIFPNTTQLVHLPAEGDLPAVAGDQVYDIYYVFFQ
jgi:hypothetical protein